MASARNGLPHALPSPNWAAAFGLVLLLIAELFGTRSLVDVKDLIGAPRGWFSESLLSLHAFYLQVLPNVGLAFGAALLVIMGGRLRASLSGLFDREFSRSRRLFLMGHLVLLGCFLWLSSYLYLRSTQASFETSDAELLVWVCLGGLTLTAWLFAVATPGRWMAWLRWEWKPVLASVLVALTAWGAGELTKLLWRPLATGTFVLARQLLEPFYNNLVSVPGEDLLGSPDFMVTIAPYCSGYQGIGLVLAFFSAYLWLFRANLRFPHALLLLPIAVAVIWLSNVVRIAVLVAIGMSWSPEVAVGGFHSQAGWIAFLLVSLGLVVLTRRSRFFALDRTQHEKAEHATLAAALLVPLLVFLASGVLTRALSSTGFDPFYGVRVVAAGIALWWFRRAYVGLGWSVSWVSLGIGAAVFVLWIALHPEGSQELPTIAPGLDALPETVAGLWIISRAVGSIVIAPIVEELAFRGYLLRKLIAQRFEDVPLGRFTWLSFLVSSLAFGALHGSWISGTLAGMAYALALYHRGRMGDAVGAHVTTNALLAGYVLVFGQWHFWG